MGTTASHSANVNSKGGSLPNNGHAEFRWPDGAVYIGEWKNSALHGQGTMIFPNGNEFEGRFVKNNPDGPGVLRTKDGYEVSGNFKCMGRTGRSQNTPVCNYQINVFVKDCESNTSQEYKGAASLRLQSGLVMLPNMSPPTRSLPISMQVGTFGYETMETDTKYTSPVASLDIKKSEKEENLNQSLLYSSSLESQKQFDETNFVEAVEAKECIIFGVEDIALEPKKNLPSFHVNLLNPRNYF